MKYETNVKDFVLRPATPEDIDEILSLIKAIAAYEEMSDSVVATKKSLYESIFVKQRANVILALEKDKVIGYMLYFYNYSTFTGGANLYLEDLFLYKEYRNKGYGKIMLKTLAKIALEENAKRIDWVCLDWNSPSLEFYKKIGAERMDFWVLHRLNEKEIKKIAEENF